MGVGLRSLAEDGVDFFMHTWSVGFFLLLTLLLLTVPDKPSETHTVIPVVQEPKQDSSSSSSSSQLSLPPYVATCWCPEQFEASQIAYVNAVCAKAYTSYRQGKIQYRPSFMDFMDRVSPSIPEPDVTKPDASGKDESTSKTGSGEAKAKTKKTLPQVALFLFVLALALRFPQMLCSVVARCCDSVNIERTLQSAEKGDTMHHEDRRHMYAGLVRAFKHSTRMGGKTTTYLYLLMKMFMILILVTEIIVVTVCVLPQLQETAKSQNANASHPPTPTPSPSSLPSTTATNDIPDEQETGTSNLEESPLYHCFFQIRFMTNVHDFTVQCVMNERQEATTPSSTPPQPFTMAHSVFLIVLANLATLLVAHVFNTLIWLVCLSSDSTRNRLGLSGNSSLDMVFFIQMARSNLGIGVAVGLAEANDGGESSGGEGQGQHLLKIL